MGNDELGFERDGRVVKARERFIPSKDWWFGVTLARDLKHCSGQPKMIY